MSILFGKILLRKYIFFEENPTKQNPKIYGIDLKILGQPQNLLNFPSTLTQNLFGSPYYYLTICTMSLVKIHFSIP